METIRDAGDPDGEPERAGPGRPRPREREPRDRETAREENEESHECSEGSLGREQRAQEDAE
jgi:hypothetical protein